MRLLGLLIPLLFIKQSCQLPNSAKGGTDVRYLELRHEGEGLNRRVEGRHPTKPLLCHLQPQHRGELVRLILLPPEPKDILNRAVEAGIPCLGELGLKRRFRVQQPTSDLAGGDRGKRQSTPRRIKFRLLANVGSCRFPKGWERLFKGGGLGKLPL